MEVVRLTGFTGAQIVGVDLSASIDDDTANRLRSCLDAHHVLVFPGQHLTIRQQLAVTQLFGDPVGLPYVTPMVDQPNVIAVLKEAHEVGDGVFGGDWHSDFSFLENPPAGSVLSAVELPPFGGDTVWANQVTAYRTLPAHLREIVDGTAAVHVGAPYGVAHAPAESARSGASIEMRRGDPEADRERLHPAVLTLPETGEQALFVNPIYTTRLASMTGEESAPVLAEIYRHATRPDLCYRHRWRVGDLVIWNNRAVMHYATNDYDGHRRLLYRTTFGRAVPR